MTAFKPPQTTAEQRQNGEDWKTIVAIIDAVRKPLNWSGPIRSHYSPTGAVWSGTSREPRVWLWPDSAQEPLLQRVHKSAVGCILKPGDEYHRRHQQVARIVVGTAWLTQHHPKLWAALTALRLFRNQYVNHHLPTLQPPTVAYFNSRETNESADT